MIEERTYYEEANRYIDNAEETFKKSPIEDGHYVDNKYTVSAMGIAYAGIERAAKWYLKLKGVKLKSEKVEGIKESLARVDKKLLRTFNNLYSFFHIDGYYQNYTKKDVIKINMDDARKFIEILKPYQQTVLYKNGGEVQRGNFLQKLLFPKRYV